VEKSKRGKEGFEDEGGGPRGAGSRAGGIVVGWLRPVIRKWARIARGEKRSGKEKSRKMKVEGGGGEGGPVLRVS